MNFIRPSQRSVSKNDKSVELAGLYRSLRRKSLACAALLAAGTACAWAPVYVAGSDFEGYALTPGQVTVAGSITGWTMLPPATGSTVQMGVFYPSTGYYSYSTERPFGSINAAPIGALGPHALFMYLPKAGDGLSHDLGPQPGGKLLRITVALGARLTEPIERFSGARITLSNGTQILGSATVTRLPRRGVFQDASLEVDLGANGCSNCVLRITSLGQARAGSYLDFDNVRVDILDGASSADASGLTVDQPLTQQVVQRRSIAQSTRYSASVPVLGHVWGAARAAGTTVSATLVNADGSPVDGVPVNQPMPFDVATGQYSGRLAATVEKGGNYRVVVSVAAVGAPTRTRTISDVGIGDVYLTAGQSNSAAFGSWGATQYVATNTQARVGNVDNSTWTRLSTDPLPSISTFYTFGTGFGSIWPRFGELASQRAGVPIGVVAVGQGGSAAAEWLSGTQFNERNFGYALRFLEPGGLKAVLWHQGESDAGGGTSQAIYTSRMSQVINGMRRKTGAEVAWYVAEVSAFGSAAMGPRGAIAASHRQLTRVLSDVYPGAATDYAVDSGFVMDGIHFNAAGLELHARQWADVLTPGAPLAPVFANADFTEISLTPRQILLFGGAYGTPPGGATLGIKGWYAINGTDTGFTEGGVIGIFSPSTDFYPAASFDPSGRPIPPGATDGQIGFMFNVPAGSGFYQASELVAQAGASYRLTARLGRRVASDGTFPGARVQLMVGGRTVTTRTVTLADFPGGPGSFSAISLDYTAPATTAPHQKLAVRVQTIGAPANNYLDLDGVSLQQLPTASKAQPAH